MSFEALVNKLEPKIKGIAHKLNGHFTFFSDEDLCQEALIYLWISWKEKRLDGKTDSYVLQGCYFHLKNYLRKTLDKVPMVSIDELAGDNDAAVSREELLPNTDAQKLVDSVEGDMLKGRIFETGLTDRERMVVSLCLDGLTVREIGHRLGVSHVYIVKMKKCIRAKCAFLKRGLPKE